MISKQNAITIAHQYVEGVILQEDITEIMSPSSPFPKSWLFHINHQNQDEDIFHTIIEITNMGFVSQWNRHYIKSKEDII